MGVPLAGGSTTVCPHPRLPPNYKSVLLDSARADTASEGQDNEMCYALGTGSNRVTKAKRQAAVRPEAETSCGRRYAVTRGDDSGGRTLRLRDVECWLTRLRLPRRGAAGLQPARPPKRALGGRRPPVRCTDQSERGRGGFASPISPAAVAL